MKLARFFSLLIEINTRVKTLAPLKMKGATGSTTNPITIY